MEKTKRELLISAISSLIKIQVKLENEIRNADDFTNKERLPDKLEAIKEQITSLVKILDIYFTYQNI